MNNMEFQLRVMEGTLMLMKNNNSSSTKQINLCWIVTCKKVMAIYRELRISKAHLLFSSCRLHKNKVATDYRVASEELLLAGGEIGTDGVLID